MQPRRFRGCRRRAPQHETGGLIRRNGEHYREMVMAVDQASVELRWIGARSGNIRTKKIPWVRGSAIGSRPFRKSAKPIYANGHRTFQSRRHLARMAQRKLLLHDRYGSFSRSTLLHEQAAYFGRRKYARERPGMGRGRPRPSDAAEYVPDGGI